MSGVFKDSFNCEHYSMQMQDYLDKTLPRKESMSLFLHIRDCDGCRGQLESMQELFSALGSLPQVPAPEDFDTRILASVPYAAYREMAELRKDRLPVILEEEILPAAIRSGAIRIAGVTMASLTAAGLIVGWLPEISDPDGAWAPAGGLGQIATSLTEAVCGNSP